MKRSGMKRSHKRRSAKRHASPIARRRAAGSGDLKQLVVKLKQLRKELEKKH